MRKRDNIVTRKCECSKERDAMEKLRYENKYLIGAAAETMLLGRLRAVAASDPHANAEGAYHIRSLYFDDCYRTALMDKEEGYEMREKFRIRYYNLDPSRILWDSTQTLGTMTRKYTAPLRLEQAWRMGAGEYDCLRDSDDPLLRRFYNQALLRRFQPRVVVDYVRLPFLFRDVRVTVDQNLHSGLYRLDFLNPRMPTVPVLPGGQTILEVKYDQALPDIIRRVLETTNVHPSAISKFLICQRFLY